MRSVFLSFGLTALPAAAALAGATAPALGADAKDLFLTHCAACHGETGDGQGVTQLDRPARSFKDGGFSFGNTPKALFRTITSGIPGTPMPAFESALDEDERRAVAEYVLELGPPLTESDPRRAVLEVSDRPLVVRGHLPSIAEGAPERPRGLLVGMPSGLTFEWRTDDVRLLGLRMGGFVDRRDWGGRGGTPLQPLGKVVHLVGDGDPDAPWRIQSGKQARDDGMQRVLTEPLQARFAGTWVRGADAGLRYRLEDEQGEVLAVVEDDLRALGTSVGSGYRRRVTLRSAARPASVYFVFGNPGGERVAKFESQSIDWEVRRLGEALFECAGLWRGGEDEPLLESSSGPLVKLALGEGREGRLVGSVVVTAAWNDDVRAALESEVQP